MEFDNLYIWTSNIELIEAYTKHTINHNKQISTEYPNAGFDLLVPNDFSIELLDSKIVHNTEVICCMKNSNNIPLSYYLYPRSSITKTPLRLANSVGIIDSGYRGTIKAVFDIKKEEFDNTSEKPIIQEKFTRIVQICSPTLKPLKVTFVEKIEDLGITSRGSGGFGSTGL